MSVPFTEFMRIKMTWLNDKMIDDFMIDSTCINRLLMGWHYLASSISFKWLVALIRIGVENKQPNRFPVKGFDPGLRLPRFLKFIEDDYLFKQ